MMAGGPATGRESVGSSSDAVEGGQNAREKRADDRGEGARVEAESGVGTAKWSRSQLLILAVVLVGVGVLAYLNREAFDLSAWWRDLRPGWVVVAVVCSALTLVGNAVNLIGVAPVGLRFRRTVAVQAAGTVARLVSPAVVGAAAVNVQYLRKAGTGGVAAVGAVTVAQSVQFLTTLTLLLPIGVLTGVDLLAVGRQWLGAAVVAGIAIGLGLLALPAIRRSPRLADRFRRLGVDLGRSLRAISAEPRKAMVSIGGSLVISLGLTGSLYASVHGFGGSLGFTVTVSALLFGSTVGNMVPVPGGIGSMDTALVAALVAAGLPLQTALPAVLFHRLVTLWLQVPVGLACLPWLRRRGLL